MALFIAISVYVYVVTRERGGEEDGCKTKANT